MGSSNGDPCYLPGQLPLTCPGERINEVSRYTSGMKGSRRKHPWRNKDWGKQNIGIRTAALGLVCAQRLSAGCPKIDLLAETYAPVGWARERDG